MGAGDVADLVGRAGEADDARVEVAQIVAQHRRRVARGIGGDEQGLDTRRSLGVALLEPAQRGADQLQVDRADVGAIGVAEIDDPVPAGEFLAAHPPPFVAGQRERPAHRGAGERRRAGIDLAGAERQGEGGEEEAEGLAPAIVHGAASLALLRVRDQAE